MLKSAKSLFKLSSSSRNPQPPPPPPPPPAPAALPPPPMPLPASFLCPISSLLMSDPVIVPSGHSFDLPCIQACRDLKFTPPHLNLPTFPFTLIPNLNLLHAILDWCHRSGHPIPTSISSHSALHFVRGLMSNPTPPPPPPPPPPPSSFSIDPVIEHRILDNLQDHSPLTAKESTMADLINTPLCSPRILAAVIPLLSSLDSNHQLLAARVLLALSILPANRTHILRCGAVPPLIVILDTGYRRASAAAAGTLCRLSMEEPNHLAIGALGAIPPLLDKLCGYFLTPDARVDAALALNFLSNCRQNLEVLVENRGVGRLMKTAGDELSPRAVRKQALILMHCVVGSRRGMEEVMEGGGIEVLLRLAKETEGVGMSSLMVMYRICRESKERFREVARAAGGEEMLVEEVEHWGHYEKDMARGLVSTLRSEGEQQVNEEMKEVEKGMVGEEVEDSKGKKKVSFH